jgi:predicted nucleic acid-binding protein
MTERVLLDTNVLIAAADESRDGHLEARRLIEAEPRDLIIAGQSAREFLVVATRPLDVNGYGLSSPHAAAVLAEHTATLTVVDESGQSRRTLIGFVASNLVRGKQIHDANLVAVALDHGATAIVTANPGHFDRFAHLIRVESLVPA